MTFYLFNIWYKSNRTGSPMQETESAPIEQSMRMRSALLMKASSDTIMRTAAVIDGIAFRLTFELFNSQASATRKVKKLVRFDMKRLLAGILMWGAAWLPTLGAAAGPLPIVGTKSDYDALLERIGSARIVMLGEATHGSREFYRERVRITRRLVDEKGFDAVVLEAPWEPVRLMDAYIRGIGQNSDASAALRGFIRFPRWMWRNTEMRDFVESLRKINLDRLPEAPLLRIYGMDLYSVPESADAVVRQVARGSIVAATQARKRYACFNNYPAEPMLYGRDVELGRSPSCAEGAERQLEEMAAADLSDEDAFSAWQSARVVKNGDPKICTLDRAHGDAKRRFAIQFA